MRSAPRFRSSLFRSRSGLNERFLGNIYLVHYPQPRAFWSLPQLFSSYPFPTASADPNAAMLLHWANEP